MELMKQLEVGSWPAASTCMAPPLKQVADHAHTIASQLSQRGPNLPPR